MISSEIIKPKILQRSQNDVTLSWEKVADNNNKLYQLQIFNDLKEWSTILWGAKKQIKVQNLAPCTCYSFRIKFLHEDEWTYFKAATEDSGPHTSVMHMARAVKLAKPALIKKIAHSRPILLHTANKNHQTPTIQAIQHGDLQTLQLLINLGADVNSRAYHDKRTPLMTAVYIGQLQLAEFLMEKGADSTLKDINGLNVLHHAVDSNSINSVKFCIELEQIRINERDNNGWSPLLRAVILDSSQEIVEYLLENGACKNLKDKNGLDYEKHLYLKQLKFD